MTTSILVVEDNLVNRELLSSLLEAHGFAVSHAATASIGIEMARATAPRLILMDLSLPGLSGLDATRMLKADPATAAIPVVAVTAHAYTKNRTDAMSAGCSAFITKPIDTRIFILEIRRILGQPSSGDST